MKFFKVKSLCSSEKKITVQIGDKNFMLKFPAHSFQKICDVMKKFLPYKKNPVKKTWQDFF